MRSRQYTVNLQAMTPHRVFQLVGKSAGNNEPQKERRTQPETKDDYLAAFPWRGSAMELVAAYTTHRWG